MSISVPHLRDGHVASSLAGRLAGQRAPAEGMTDWAWIASRLGECEPGHRMQESAVRRRDEALASAERVMSLRDQQH